MPKPEALRRSQAQEKRVAAATGGQTTKGSGSGWNRKGDVREDAYLWEMKRTDGKAISLKLVDWEKIRAEAYLDGRTPAMHLEIGSRRLVVLDENDFVELRERGEQGTS